MWRMNHELKVTLHLLIHRKYCTDAVVGKIKEPYKCHNKMSDWVQCGRGILRNFSILTGQRELEYITSLIFLG